MIKTLEVFISKRKVGTISLNNNNSVFQYDDKWLENGFSINPLKLPLSKQLFESNSQYFDGLFGVFADSLPDSYGYILLDRYLKSKGLNIKSLDCLDRLSYIGSLGMGALEYIPDLGIDIDRTNIDFDMIQEECDLLLNNKEVNDIDSLYSFGAYVGGSRPKSLIKYDGEDYIVKFSSKYDSKNIAKIEYDCMSKAKEAGINIPEIKIVTTNSGNKYFLIKRFDRNKGKKIHVISAAGLLECDFQLPSVDYNTLVKLTRVITSDEEDVIEIYRRMVFNVLIDNQDDHAKNFSFLYDEEKKKYVLSPAYDITTNKTYYLEHMTSVNGKGKNITDDDMIQVAINNKIDIELAKEIIKKVKSAFNK